MEVFQNKACKSIARANICNISITFWILSSDFVPGFTVFSPVF